MGSGPRSPVLILGGGIAGLSTALRLADAGHRVVILTKTALSETASFRAQGGIAAVTGAGDSFSVHESDTVRAGAGLCREEIVERVVGEGPDCIRWLEGQGVRFTQSPEGGLHLTREGGHSCRRIVHADDATGRAVMSVLAEKAGRHRGIELLEGCFAMDLVTARQLGMPGPNRCLGVTVIRGALRRVETLWADTVVLATGGASGVYAHATNASTGDGIAMAWRAGCRVSNMEFVQFHPTCLYHPRARSVLISEALRGEGARLLLPDGSRFMARYHEKGELAPRDVVSRAIAREMAAGGLEHVLLDISHEPAELVHERFPNILRACARFGFDLTRQPIPVVPAAHYTCGGVVTDARGETDLARLYAVGEAGCTGLHGANRLASNSLLEALVFAKSASVRIDRVLRRRRSREYPAGLPGGLPAVGSRKPAWIAPRAAEIKRVMWDQAGIVRTHGGLAAAAAFLEDVQSEMDTACRGAEVHPGTAELRNLATVARLITQSALRREESRGLHYIAEHPSLGKYPRDTALQLTA